MSESGVAATLTQEDSASLQDWIAVLAGALGALIASLDISIVNSALPTIQGEIGANGTEGTWIGTGYLVSEVVMIPLSAWLSRVLGLRTLLLTCAILFTLFSMVCGISHDLSTMILGRVGQGFFGGALIPTAQTITRQRLPPRQFPIGMTLFGLIVLLGPLAGPVLGGWLAENIGWQWCFFLNLPIAVALVTLLLLGLPHQKTDLEALVGADWLGIIGMAVGLSSLTVVLEEGQRERWFESGLIVLLTCTTILGLFALVLAQFTARRPILRLSLLLRPSYASVIFIVTVVGMVLYGIMYVLPQFLSGIAHYNSEQSGRILFLSGVPAMCMMPVLPLMLRRVNAKLMVATGLLCFAASCFLDVALTTQSSGGDFVESQLLRGFGQMFCFLPLNQASMAAVSREEAGEAAGLYNMSRNLGGSIGLALLGVFIDRRVESHVEAIGTTVSANSTLVQDRITGQAAALGEGDLLHGQVRALAQLAGAIRQQAMVMTYSECFWALGVALIAMLPLVLVLRPPPPAGFTQAGH